MTATTRSDLYGRTTGTRTRELPMRQLNACMWGHVSAGDGPVRLGGCGRPVDPGQRVPIYGHDQRWVPGALATCDNALLCDFCSDRFWAKSSDRFKVHFTDWFDNGGQLLHITLTLPHGPDDRLADLMAGLLSGFKDLRESDEWRAAGIVDWVRVLHLRWSETNGWHPHYHVTAFARPGFECNWTAAFDQLQAAWRDSLYRKGFASTSKKHGLTARFFASGMRALYAWDHRRDEDDEPDYGYSYEPQHAPELEHDYEPNHDPSLDQDYDPEHSGSLSLREVAVAALEGDQRAWRVWEEACLALRGKPVVHASKMLNEVWKDYMEANPEPEPETLDLEPVMFVSSKLWERARRAGCTQMGLAVGAEHGPRGLAQFWATRLGLELVLEPSGQGPPVLACR